MAYLLDTHIVLWLANEPKKLSRAVKSILAQKQHTVYFSSVNIWEVAIKAGLNKENFNANPQDLYKNLLKNQYVELPVLSKHAMLVEKLAPIHHDPFDRLLIAQAMSENLTLITHDSNIVKYQGLNIFQA